MWSKLTENSEPLRERLERPHPAGSADGSLQAHSARTEFHS